LRRDELEQFRAVADVVVQRTGRDVQRPGDVGHARLVADIAGSPNYGLARDARGTAAAWRIRHGEPPDIDNF
jgi:hypothetical protein